MPTITVATAFELALQHHRAGRYREAEALYRQILAVDPRHAAAQSNLGDACRMMGRLDEGIAAFRGALQLDPDFPEAHYNLGLALAQSGRLDEAADAFRRALEIKPGYVEAHNNLGNALKAQGHLDEAGAAYRRALEIQPDCAEAYSNLGTILQDQGHLDDAMAALRRALASKPDYADAHNNLGNVLTELGRFDEARAAVDRALELQPDYAAARFNRAFLLLLRGDFEHGWPLYEARWEVSRSRKPAFSQPMWDGRRVDGLRVLIHAEQGLGDAIQFIRYAGLVAGRGGEVVVACPRPLERLFRRVKGVRAVVAQGDPLPAFDLHVPMLSQPLIFQTRRESIPREVPYLFADPLRGEHWKQWLGGDRSRLRVGLAWSGDPQHRRNRTRDIPLQTLLGVWRVPGVDFFSLQIGPEATQMRQFPGAAAIIDHTAQIQDLADTAALIGELDLVISVDTAVAHLAGALGRPVWTLLPFVPDWRWGLERGDTAWYPTMRLFRQPALGDWDSVVQNVAGELGLLQRHPPFSDPRVP